MTFQDRPNNPTAVSATFGRGLGKDPRANGTAELAKSLVMPVILAAFATYFLVGIAVMDVPEGTMFPGPGFFPGLIAAGLYLFAVLLAVAAVKQKRRDAKAAAERDLAIVEGRIDPSGGADADEGDDRGRLVWSSLAWIVLGFAGFALTLELLGWIIGAAALFWCVARGFGERRYIASAVVGLAASSVAYIAFDMMLGLSLPSGILGWGF